jgi:hypothetical protein
VDIRVIAAMTAAVRRHFSSPPTRRCGSDPVAISGLID